MKAVQLPRLSHHADFYGVIPEALARYLKNEAAVHPVWQTDASSGLLLIDTPRLVLRCVGSEALLARYPLRQDMRLSALDHWQRLEAAPVIERWRATNILIEGDGFLARRFVNDNGKQIHLHTGMLAIVGFVCASDSRYWQIDTVRLSEEQKTPVRLSRAGNAVAYFLPRIVEEIGFSSTEHLANR